MINQGERDEILVKLRLIEIRDSQKKININGTQTIVTSVGFNGIEYRKLSAGTNLRNIEIQANAGNMNPLNATAAACGIKKAGGRDKADVFINGKGYSVKSHQSAPPAIVNHTPRNGWLRIANEKGLNINKLDEIIVLHWERRKAGIIKEDTCVSDPNCPFSNEKDYMRPFLQYSLYEGSGSASSKVPAKGMLEFDRSLDEGTWHFTIDGYLDKVWNNLVFSVRNKGMKPSYPDCQDYDVIKKWTEFFQGSYKGSLHVRVR